MKTVGIIPTRYNSTRFPGKALVMLDGKPMILRVWEAAKSCPALNEVYVATDSDKISRVCQEHGVSVIMTKHNHQNPTSRVWEASERINADLYMMIGGDEPLISPKDIKRVAEDAGTFFCSRGWIHKSTPPAPLIFNAMTSVTEQAEIADSSNIKVVHNKEKLCIYASRSPIPYGRGGFTGPYMKFVSIGAYTKSALDFFSATLPGMLEQAEECDLLRFLENRIPVYLTDIRARTLSVDTAEDFEKVVSILRQKHSREEKDNETAKLSL